MSNEEFSLIIENVQRELHPNYWLWQSADIVDNYGSSI